MFGCLRVTLDYSESTSDGYALEIIDWRVLAVFLTDSILPIEVVNILHFAGNFLLDLLARNVLRIVEIVLQNQ